MTVGGSAPARRLVPTIVGRHAGVPGGDGAVPDGAADGPRVEPLPSPVALVDVLPGVDLAVSAAGVTAYELACAGVPALVVALVENQQRVARACAEAGVALGLDGLRSDWAEQLEGKLRRLTHPAVRRAMAMPARAPSMGVGRAARLGRSSSDGPVPASRRRERGWSQARERLASGATSLPSNTLPIQWTSKTRPSSSPAAPARSARRFVEALLDATTSRRRSASSAATSSSSREMQRRASATTTALRFFIGDVRDRDRLTRATRGVDVIVHAAALKQVPACEYNPFEAVQTNVLGAENVVDGGDRQRRAARRSRCRTDKAVNPVNLYGATKLCAEKIFAQGNAYAADSADALRVRALRQRRRQPRLRRPAVPGAGATTGALTITDERMTRFWITLDAGRRLRALRARAAWRAARSSCPRSRRMRVIDLAEAIAPGRRSAGSSASARARSCTRC